MSVLKACCQIEITGQTPVPVVLMLRPRSGLAQWVFREAYSITPRVQIVEYTDGFGNICQRAILAAADIHAWFEAYVGGRWFTFDGTHEQTAGNRIVIAYDRDATDLAFVTQFGSLAIHSLRVVVTQES